MFSWVSPVLGWALKCLAQGHSREKTRRIQCGSNPGPLDYELNTLPLSQQDPGKLEIQLEKVCDAIDDVDELVDMILEEDTELCKSARAYCDKLKHIEDDLKEEQRQTTLVPDKKSSEMEKLLDLQKELQKELLVKRSEKPKHIPTSI